MKRFTAVLALLLIVPAAGATTIQQENITVELGDRDQVTVERHYAAITTERISYLVLGRHNPTDLSARDAAGTLDCTVEELSIGKELLCTPRQRSNYTVTITFSGDFGTRDDGVRRFSYANRIFVPTRAVTTRVVLPEGYGIVEGDGAYEPGGARVGSRGRRIFLEWHHRNVSIGDSIGYSVRYEQLGVLESLRLRWLTAVLAVAVLVLAGLVVYVRRKHAGEKTVADMFPVLKEDEQEVVRYIIDHEGEVEQRDIVDSLDYSKAKISRLVSDLADRGLVRKEKKGRVNVVELAREVGDVEA
ncbi:MAG: MarR family transcriptional regulator [Candidatus Nanohaloarchaea archaeon]|nr:MarR family transcriptional regulator [Candidatus Nanohaloarchaea archaeon]